jgi:hypothetical protein
LPTKRNGPPQVLWAALVWETKNQGSLVARTPFGHRMPHGQATKCVSHSDPKKERATHAPAAALVWEKRFRGASRLAPIVVDHPLASRWKTLAGDCFKAITVKLQNVIPVDAGGRRGRSDGASLPQWLPEKQLCRRRLLQGVAERFRASLQVAEDASPVSLLIIRGARVRVGHSVPQCVVE